MNKYQTILSEEYYGLLGTSLSIMIAVIVAIVFVFIIKRKIKNKQERTVSIVTFIVLILMMLCIAGYTTIGALAIKKDLDNNLFVTYYGEYKLVYEGHFTVCYINNGTEQIELRCLDIPSSGFETGTGYVIYSKNSLYVVDIYE